MMSSHTYAILSEQAQEDSLHALRLLQVEERPFQRVTRTLLAPTSLLKHTPPTHLPSPPPDDDPTTSSQTPAPELDLKRAHFRNEVLLDFAALESSILRIQLLHASNARERDRYAAEKAKIVSTAQAVRDNTVALRAQLAEAQKMLEFRKGYDGLAQRIIFDAKLKPRAETGEEIRALEKEIEELEVEGGEFEGVWAGRKEVWGRVVEVGEELVRAIHGVRDEVEVEAEADEKMEGGDEGADGKETSSRMGTPGVGGSTPMVEGGGETPVVGDGGQTPMLEDGRSPAPVNKFLEVEDAGTRSGSRVSSPMLQATVIEGDVEMEGDEEAETMATEKEAANEGEDTQLQVETDQMDES